MLCRLNVGGELVTSCSEGDSTQDLEGFHLRVEHLVREPKWLFSLKLAREIIFCLHSLFFFLRFTVPCKRYCHGCCGIELGNKK